MQSGLFAVLKGHTVKNFTSLVLSIFFTAAFSASVFAAEGETLQHDAKETWGWRTAMISSLILTLAANPFDADEYSIAMMHSEADVAGFKVGFRWFPESDLAFLSGTNFTHYYHLAYNYWQSLDVSGQEGVNNVVELSPIFRYNISKDNWFSFIETSVGISVFSRSSMNEKQFSTNFQFANMLAVGGYISEKASWNLQLQHYSNNSIKLPNNGINFYNFGISYKY